MLSLRNLVIAMPLLIGCADDHACLVTWDHALTEEEVGAAASAQAHDELPVGARFMCKGSK